MAFPARLIAIIARAGHDVTAAAAALMICGLFLGSSALALAIFKAPPSAASGSPFQVPGYAYYGFLAGTVLFGLAEGSFGFWAVARDPERWAGVAKFLLWVSILPQCVVVALGSLAFVA
ncbi:hypothetical protein C2845_PM15G22260 [Panicum miliaceum]|uniref:Uncharacterized protein n=1 Tax=Panicum miliaceum TaxID=4540 RepID=A0A3L6QAC3_PANMI|nr:hypothetical protein C2845_PM15G22260 [Panicum miliaceum]